MELYGHEGTIKYRGVLTDENFMKSLGFKSAFRDSK